MNRMTCSIFGTLLALALSACSTTSSNVQTDNQPTDFKTKYAVVTNVYHITLWTRCESVWMPTDDDLKPIYMALKRYLEKKQSTWERLCQTEYERTNYTFVREHLDEYNREYAGVVIDGHKHIFCSLILPIGEYNPSPSRLGCLGIMDGGAAVVEVYYDVEKHEVTSLGWNCEA